MQKTRRTDSLMSLREIQPCACMMRTWRWHNLMLSREFWPLRRGLVTFVLRVWRTHNVKRSSSSLVRSVPQTQALSLINCSTDSTNVMPTTGRLFSQLSGKRVALRVVLNVPISRNRRGFLQLVAHWWAFKGQLRITTQTHDVRLLVRCCAKTRWKLT